MNTRTQKALTFTCASMMAAAGAAAFVVGDQHRDNPHQTRDMQPRYGEHDRDAKKHADKEHKTLKGMRVAVLTGEGLHDMETLAPIAYLSNRGAEITVLGIEPGMVSAYNSDIEVRIDRSVGDASIHEFHALVLPGGRAPDSIREHDEVVRFAGDFFRSGKPVAAICHGPQILVTAGVLDGFEATCIESISDEIESAGADYTDEEVVVDRNLITSRLPEDIPAFVQAIEEQMIEWRVTAAPERTDW